MKRLTVVVSGYLVSSPLAGFAWHVLNYVHGLVELGHDVYFVEELIHKPYNPVTRRMGVDSSYGRRFLEESLRGCERPVPYCYYSRWDERYYGLDLDGLRDLFKRADLMICVCGITRIRDDLPRPRRLLVIDTDPVYTQFRMTRDPVFLEYYKRFDAVATFGKLIGTDKCSVPTHGIEWIPTNQAVSLRQWNYEGGPSSHAFTTISGWAQNGEGYCDFQGHAYQCTKDVEWLKVIDVARRVPWEMSIAMETQGVRNEMIAVVPPEVQDSFQDRGWRFLDPVEISLTTEGYKRFINNAAGEFTVAKEQYVGIPSGWFSDRSALFLAKGRPVVTQETGFSEWLPTGQGLFGFLSADEASAALNEIYGDYKRHSRAARSLAQEHFDAKKVIGDLLARVL